MQSVFFCEVANILFLMIFLSSLTLVGGSEGKESACNEGNLSSIPGLGRSPGEGHGNPLQHSGLESSMDYTVHGTIMDYIMDYIILKMSKKCH